MDENLLRQMQKRLNSMYYATNDAWLRDCVEYYLSEHNNPKDNEVLEFVKSQWQLSDLREISNEKPCLPRSLNREKCTTLQGQFILQMEHIYDIAESKYKQIEKIRNLSNDNVEIGNGEKTQGDFVQPKGKRMLYLKLTDGTQDVVGIEYKPISFLNDTLLPGYKLLIKGPVTCRLGVIMLEDRNIAEIGGEVDKLIVPNAVENVLARALNLPENPDPYRENVETKTEEDLFNDDFDIDMNDMDLIERQSQEEISIGTTETPKNPSSIVMSNQSVNNVRAVERERNQPSPATLDFRSESDLFFDTIDDSIFDDVEMTEVSRNPVIDSAPTLKNPNAVLPINVHTSDVRTNDFVELTERRDTSCRNIEKNSWRGSVETISTRTEPTKTTRTAADSSTRLSFNIKSTDCTTITMSELKTGNDSRECALTSTKPTYPDSLPTKPVVTTVSNKRTAAVLSPPSLNSPVEKMHCPKTASVPKTAKTNKKITDYMTKGGKSLPEAAKLSSEVRSNSKTYDTLNDVLNASVTDTVVYKTIRCKVVDFDKLTRNDKGWQLNATLKDNTENTMVIAISNEIVQSLLGFSVDEFSQQKKMAKTDPEKEKYLRQVFRNAEKKLLEIDGLLRVELELNKKPVVVKLLSDNNR